MHPILEVNASKKMVWDDVNVDVKSEYFIIFKYPAPAPAGHFITRPGPRPRPILKSPAPGRVKNRKPARLPGPGQLEYPAPVDPWRTDRSWAIWDTCPPP